MNDKQTLFWEILYQRQLAQEADEDGRAKQPQAQD